MRIVTSLRAAALGLALAAPLFAGFATSTPARAQIEVTIWRDQARIAAHTDQAAPRSETKIAKGPRTTIFDGVPAPVAPERNGDRPLNGAGLPVSPRTGVELPGYAVGGF